MQADEIAKHARAEADELQHLAQQRYEDVVGSLADRRESLQQQIEALERFDREHRARLQAFMQGQLRARWVDEPRADPGSLAQPDPASASAVASAQRDDSDQLAEPVPMRWRRTYAVRRQRCNLSPCLLFPARSPP